MRRALVVVFVVNLVAMLAKLEVGRHTDSLTVLGAALESALDMLNNILGISLVAVASRAPDEDHPYGHAKFETLGALGIVGFLSISCFELLREAVASLGRPAAMERPTAAAIAVLLLTLAANIVITIFERRRGRALASAWLVADATHTRSDMFVTLLALLSLWLTRMGLGRLDAALAIAVAAIIARSGYQILRQSIPVLVDERGVDAHDLATIVARVPEVQTVRAARSRMAPGGRLFVDVTIAVRGSTTVEHAHRLADAVEAAIAAAFGNSEVTVHVEPL